MFEQLRENVEKTASSFSTQREKEMFTKCFFNTLDTTCKFQEDGSVFIITGDIPAMWLRDSAAQVMQYLYYAEDSDVQKLIKGVLRRQFQMILIDPYANAFMLDETFTSEWEGMVKSDYLPKIVWERKFELDSLCYPLFLLSQYFDKTGDREIIDELFIKAFDKIYETFERERKHSEQSSYYFHFYREEDGKTVDVGKNNPATEKGLIWSGFRPSDDACKYPYHIPDNMFVVAVLYKMQRIFGKILGDQARAEKCRKLSEELRVLIERYGVVETSQGRCYVSETDCFGSYTLDDDANIPSLLSLPYLEYPSLDAESYRNTRKKILSSENTYYYEGKFLKGIGSPHTPSDRVWPLAVAMQGITSDCSEEIKECYKMLISSDNGTGYMHESIDVNDPSVFSRPWFAWANSLFAYFVLKNKDVLIG